MWKLPMSDDQKTQLIVIQSQTAALLHTLHFGLSEACRVPAATRTACRDLIVRVTRLQNRITEVLKRCETQTNPEALYHITYHFLNRLRIYKKLTAAALASASWQSPSYTDRRQIGFRNPDPQKYDYERISHFVEDKIIVLNDYFLPMPDVHYTSLVRNCGMGAFLNIYLGYILQVAPGPDQYILFGKRSYVETLKFVQKDQPLCRFIECDEQKVNTLIRHARNPDCQGIFLDAVSNWLGSHIPDFHAIFKKLAALKRTAPLYVVIDASLVGIAFQPAAYFIDTPFPTWLHLIVYRSLLKHDQEGDDKVSAGCLTYFASKNAPDQKPVLKLNLINNALGTMLPELSMLTLDFPPRNALLYRLLRHERNARILGEHLGKLQAKYPQIIRAFSTAALQDEAKQKSGLLSVGGLLYLQLRRPKCKITLQVLNAWFIGILTSYAESQRIYLSEGSSFGFNHTRLIGFPTGVMRIATGMEDEYFMKRVLDCFDFAFYVLNHKFYETPPVSAPGD